MVCTAPATGTVPFWLLYGMETASHQPLGKAVMAKVKWDITELLLGGFLEKLGKLHEMKAVK